MTKCKKIFSLAMLPVMMATLFSVNVFADGYKYEGNCGENVRYSFNGETGELIIQGKGKIEDFSNPEDCPLHEFKNRIKSVTIGYGVTSIGNGTFCGCTNLESITLPDSVTTIGKDAFSGCTCLESINIPKSVTSIDNYAFTNCTRLNSVYYFGKSDPCGKCTFTDCSQLKEVYVSSDYEGDTFCGIKVKLIKSKKILFDFDGTLFDYDKALEIAMEQLCRKLSIEYTKQVMTEFKKCTKLAFNEYRDFKSFEEFNKKRFSMLLEDYHLANISIEEVVNTFKFYRMNTVCLYEESLDVCKKLSENYTLIIVSNGCYEVQESLIKASGLDEYIHFLITPEIVNTRKPDSKFLEEVFRLNKIEPNDCILIGDSFVEDIECAKKVGIPSIWVNRSNGNQSKYKYTVSNLREIYKHLGVFSK